MTTLTELAALLDAATGPSSYLDTYIHTWTIEMGLDDFEQGQYYPFTSSIDTALALVDSALGVDENGLPCRVFIERKPSHDGGVWLVTIRFHGCAGRKRVAIGSAPLAILRAMVAARIAKENGQALPDPPQAPADVVRECKTCGRDDCDAWGRDNYDYLDGMPTACSDWQPKGDDQ